MEKVRRHDKSIRLQDFLKENEEEYSLQEKRRTSIAKALVRNSSILVYDESDKSSKSDFEVEELILNMREMTVLSVSRQITKSLMEKYDKIFVLDQECLVEEGTFSELLIHNEYFQNLYVSNET